MFNSLLVEMGYFDKITVGFLIIGHTHASIDQYFSCLRNLIRKANFIASPLALQHLFSLEPRQSTTKKKKYRPPIKQIQLHYVHDYVTFFEPYRNNDITGYGVPYQFRIYNVLGKAVCQYKQFSDSQEWLPKQPIMKNQTLEEMHKENVHIFEDHLSMASKAGQQSFKKYIGLEESMNSLTIVDDFIQNKDSRRDTAIALQNALPTLTKGISVKGLAEQEMRRQDEEDGIDCNERYHAKDLVCAQATLEMINTKDSG